MRKIRIQKITRKILSRSQNRLRLILNNLWITINKSVTAKGGGVAFNSILKSHKPENKRIFNLIFSIKKESKQLLSDFELFHLYMLTKKINKVGGDIAEVGVYQGGSAKIMCEATNKQVHLFDTFEGLPKPGQEDVAGKYKEGDYKSSYHEVKNYLRKYRNATIYKGLFPLTSKPVENKKFSLVHLDVDLYKSTLKCLEFFYPRMGHGGVIVCHDYEVLKGVKKAIDEFFKNKPEIIIETLAGSSQCFVIKV